MKQCVIIFSGLPGTGKTTLARWLAGELKVPLIRIDDIAESHTDSTDVLDDSFWTRMIDLLLQQVEHQQGQGCSVIVDSVFMGEDRAAIRRLARNYDTNFYAIHTHCSDEALWRERVEGRLEAFPEDQPATWAQISEQRKDFQPWNPSDALFIDTADILEHNFHKVREYLEDQT